jgi:UDP-N-acetylglucosamine 2-epimerase (non-hydrolysing)
MKIHPKASPTANSAKINIVVVAGARPNFMKIAPLMHELNRRGNFVAHLVHTGQHYDDAMSNNFFRDLGIPEPDTNLGVGSGSHGEQTAQVLIQMEILLQERRPDALVVVGDVNSTLAASLAAVKLQIPIAHVEAGLRSGDRTMPEEINRILTDSISTWLFTTEPDGDRNLLHEGADPSRIHRVGNVMIDTLLANLERSKKLNTLSDLNLEPGGYGLLTLHRPANVDDTDTLRSLFGALEEFHRDLPIIFPVHPRTAAAIKEHLGGEQPGLRTTEPLGYLDFLQLMANARLVLTDSGGIQEETTALRVSCLTLRENTERPITVTQGTNTIVGLNPQVILSEARKILSEQGKQGQIPDLWDGEAAPRIVDILERDLRRAN